MKVASVLLLRKGVTRFAPKREFGSIWLSVSALTVKVFIASTLAPLLIVAVAVSL